MLNLTTGNFPFVIGFAIKVLGYSDVAVGLLAATPFICRFLQTPSIYALQRSFSHHQILAYGFVLNALPWTLIAFFPWFGQNAGWVFGAVVWLSILANAVCGVAWSAAVSELIPIGIRGRYIGARNLMFGFWTLVVVFTAGQVVDHYHNSVAVFGVIFTLAAAARLAGLYFLTRMKLPASVMERSPQESAISTFTAVFRDRQFVRLLLLTGIFGLLLNLMFKMVPPLNKAHYISVYFSFTNMLIAFGPILGGVLLHRLPARMGTWMGQPITQYHLLIVGSLGLCLLSLLLLRGRRGPAERSVKDLIQVMGKMREFNPVLGLATLGQFMFTPHGLTRLARLSVRALRRQAQAVSGVGEELVEGGRRMLKQPFKKYAPQPR